MIAGRSVLGAGRMTGIMTGGLTVNVILEAVHIKVSHVGEITIQ